MGFVFAVLIAEASFEDAGFGAGADDLQRDQDDEREEIGVIGFAEEEEEAEDCDRAEYVDGMANA